MPGKTSQPAEAHIDLSDTTLNRFDSNSSKILFRYLCSSPRWEVCEDRGIKFAIRLKQGADREDKSSNGAYSEWENNQVRVSRVVISFGQPDARENEPNNISRVTAGAKDVPLTLVGFHAGSPGNTSNLVVDGNGIFLNITEMAPETSRPFTTRAFAEVCGELTEVLAHLDEIKSTGQLPDTSPYAAELVPARTFVVEEGWEPGKYFLNTSITPTTPGYVYAKAFDAENGKPLLETRHMVDSRRFVGWSEAGDVYYNYLVEVTIYEHDWDNKYPANFELWHRSENGQETKMAKTIRTISGWER